MRITMMYRCPKCGEEWSVTGTPSDEFFIEDRLVFADAVNHINTHIGESDAKVCLKQGKVEVSRLRVPDQRLPGNEGS